MGPSAQSVRRILSRGRRQRRCHVSMCITLTASHHGSGFIIRVPYVGTSYLAAMAVMAITTKEQDTMKALAEKDRQ